MEHTEEENRDECESASGNQAQNPEAKPDAGEQQAPPLASASPGEQDLQASGELEEYEAPDEEQENAVEQAIPDEELRPIVECLLFTTHEPLSAKKIGGLLDNVPTRDVRRMILSLREEYDSQARGFQIVEVAGGFQMATRPQFAPYILKLNRHKRKNPLSIPALETLAIIAYKQPLTRAEIEAIRGVDSSGVLHNLLELSLIKIAGRKEVVGHPPLYGTTEDFLKVFGLRQIADLPSIREIREMFEKREKEEKSPAPEEAQQTGAAGTMEEKSDPSG